MTWATGKKLTAAGPVTGRGSVAMPAKTAAAPVKPLQAYNRHIISDHLKDRHPYLEDIRGHLKGDDVSMAQGDRLFPRLVEQLTAPNMAPERLVEALRTVCDLCSHQESKTVAISSDVIAAATHLLLHDAVPVRRDACRVISSMSLLVGGRGLLQVGNADLAGKLTGQISAGPTLPRLAKLLLSCDDELVKLHAAEAFQAVTIFRDGCQQVVDQGAVVGVTQYMCGTLPDLPSSPSLALCLLRLLQTMAAVTMYAKDGMRDIFSTGFGLIGKVVRFLGWGPELRTVTMYAKDGMRDIFSTGFGLIGKVVRFLGWGPELRTVWVDALKNSGVTTLGKLSYAVSLPGTPPSADDMDSFTATLRPGAPITLGDSSAMKQLIFESQTMTVAELRSAMQSTDEDVDDYP
ncbi:hypothetical protein AK812_SmicGene958 [Symbiodinium microadriaticum]|uniref:Uncharacterized protein n=1 Tax=Symbiodinium microadriaticum TaxID=2951 RepID=A0A1Q9F576_SYMMI|nr:hypothetical protein AK812_SmicGene958 [Symbiodinium microadriaticum]